MTLSLVLPQSLAKIYLHNIQREFSPKVTEGIYIPELRLTGYMTHPIIRIADLTCLANCLFSSLSAGRWAEGAVAADAIIFYMEAYGLVNAGVEGGTAITDEKWVYGFNPLVN